MRTINVRSLGPKLPNRSKRTLTLKTVKDPWCSISLFLYVFISIFIAINSKNLSNGSKSFI
jgi:hypothetical protein